MSKAIVFAHRQEPSVKRGLGVQPLTKERGRSHDQSMGRSRHPRVVSSRRARDRVGNLGIVHDLPGDRHGGRRCWRWLDRPVRLSSWILCANPLRATAKGGLSSLLLCLILGASGFALAAPWSATAQTRTESGQRAVEGGDYRRPLGNDPSTLDPARVNDIYGRSVAQQIFDGLVQFDQTLTVVPAIAQIWKA